MLRSIGKQSDESVEKKRNVAVGRICRKKVLAWNERVSCDGILIITGISRAQVTRVMAILSTAPINETGK